MWGSCVLELPEELFVGKVWLLVESFFDQGKSTFFKKKKKIRVLLSTFKH